MSILEPGVVGSTTDTPRPRAAYVLRALALLASLVSLSSLWFSEKARVADDLQLSMEATARPGEQLALRAFYLRDVEAPAGPTLVTKPVEVTLLDPHDRQIVRKLLKPARGDTSMEGWLRVPASISGRLIVDARADLHDGTPLLVRRSVEVFEQAPRLVPRHREAPPLQQLSVGSLRFIKEPLAALELELEPRIVGGACVPELPCHLLIWVGHEAVSVTVRHDASVTLGKAPEPGPLLSFQLTVHGPEAVVVLEARTPANELVAERTVRLPVALGESALSVASLVAEGDSVRVAAVPPPGREHGILDVYVAGRWAITRGFSAKEGEFSVPTAGITAGLVRLQAHSDRFAGENAGTRVLYVAPTGQDTARTLAELARLVRNEGFADPLSERWAARPPIVTAADLPRYVAFTLAPLEAVRLPLPRAVSGRPRELARLSRAQTGLRFGVAGVLALSAVIVGLTLMRRGLTAQREAEAILREGEQETGVERNTDTSSSVVFVVCLVLVVCLAFLTGALLIVAKPLWF